MFRNRYDRNMNTLSPEENGRLKDFKVLVAGCGGLGGYVIEELARIGIGNLTAVDGDVFEESNLNRQLLSTEELLGTPKARAAALRVAAINSEVKIQSIEEFITEENSRKHIKGHDLVIDALDSSSARKILENACEQEGIPLIHGAIAGWYGQVSAIMPGDRTLNKLYVGKDKGGLEKELGNPAFTPAVIASIQVAEGIKILLGKEGVLRKKLLTIDLLSHQYDVVDL